MAKHRTRQTLWRSKTFLAYVFVLSILAMLFFGAAVWSMTQNRHMQHIMLTLQARCAEQEAQVEQLQRLRDIDALVVVDGRYADALEAYRTMRDGGAQPFDAPLEARIRALNVLLSDQGNSTPTTDPKDQLLGQYRRTIEELEERAEGMQRSMAQLADSLQTRIEDMLAEMKRKEKELGKKEQVQVLSFSSTKGQKIHYLGEVRDGKANGGGVGIWTTGSVHRGQWRNNLRHGEGTFEWADGERYEGTYVDGVREGFGKYFWPSGDRYEGQWKDDRRNGQGTLYDMDGNVRYKGLWKDDKPAE